MITVSVIVECIRDRVSLVHTHCTHTDLCYCLPPLPLCPPGEATEGAMGGWRLGLSLISWITAAGVVTGKQRVFNLPFVLNALIVWCVLPVVVC